MADIVVDVESKNPQDLLKQGIKAFVLEDFTSAVQALGKASELLVTEHNGDDLHDSLGEVYIYYGKALLGLYRQESDPLGDAIPKGEDENEEEEADEDQNEVNQENEEQKADEMETNAKNADEESGEKRKRDDEKKTLESNDQENGVADASQSEEQDEPTDLQVAWEVLELAKKIFEKRAENGKKLLAECLTTLGEISLESENFEAAIADIKSGLEIQQDILPEDSRLVSETWYNLGMAYSTNSQIDEAVEAFKKSLDYLERRMKNLEKSGDEGQAEIEDIKQIVPDLMEKIKDMKCYKEEAIKKLAELAKGDKPAEFGESSSSSSKPVNNITHLVKRKRKSEEPEVAENPAKKLSQ